MGFNAGTSGLYGCGLHVTGYEEIRDDFLSSNEDPGQPDAMTLSWRPETDKRDSSWTRRNLVFEYRHVFETGGIKAGSWKDSLVNTE